MAILVETQLALDHLKMKIIRIEDIDQFDRLRTDWERVYAADPHAHIFVSWAWLRAWFEMTPHEWFVLAIQPESSISYVAFLALSVRGPRVYKFRPIRVLQMGGKPFANYTGFVCLPEYEANALATFAHYIQTRLNWDRFQMEDVLDQRLAHFLNCFPEEAFSFRQQQSMPSLYIPLTDSWEEYLQGFMGSRTRANLRRSFRQIEQKEFYITNTQAATVDKDIDTLLTLWQERWGPKPIAAWSRAILHRLFGDNCLWLRVLWDGTTPVAAQAGIIDQAKKSLYGYIISHNADYAKLSPGRAMVGYSIREAIENEFELYDFLRGSDNYKLSFGAQKRSLTSIMVTPKGLRGEWVDLVLEMSSSIGVLLVKVLGNFKRLKIVKRVWFSLLPLVRRIKQ